jgi:UDP-N-acetylglucosamine 2-epimerase
MLKNGNNWGNPFGDGEAGKRIIQIIREKYD